MSDRSNNQTRSKSRVCYLSVGLIVLLGSLVASVAQANWGEDWGDMTWGGLIAALPTLGDWGTLLLLALFIGTALLVISKRRGVRSTFVVLLAIGAPHTSHAGMISIPYLFSNGTPADANEVNANFLELAFESNAQDLRIAALEAGIGHTHPGSDITSRVADADTVDGVHASALEESAEIDSEIALHASAASAHHTRYTNAEALLAAIGVDAGTLDGINSTGFASAAHAHTGYVAKGGDTMTGPLVGASTGSSYAIKGAGANPPSNGYVGVQGATDFDGILTADWTGREIGLAGISTGASNTDNYGLIGHSNWVGARGEHTTDPANNYGELGRSNYGMIGRSSSVAVRGEHAANPAGNFAELGRSDTGVYGQGTARGLSARSDSGYAVYGNSQNGLGVYGYSSGAGTAVKGFSAQGDGVEASTGANYKHAGIFTSSFGLGLNGSTLLAEARGSAGIALWAVNSHVSSTDATIVFSNNGSGALMKGFGGDGGGEEIKISNDGTLTLHNDAGQAVISLDSDYSGSARVITQELQITGGSDLSETFDISSVRSNFEPGPGMVVSIDPEHSGSLIVADTAYDRRVAGIISGAGGVNTGMLMGQKGSVADGASPVALTGRVYCYADASNGPIAAGDMLTTSDTPGHAMKATDYSRAQGAILGKSMSSLEDGTGLVLVLVSLQ